MQYTSWTCLIQDQGCTNQKTHSSPSKVVRSSSFSSAPTSCPNHSRHTPRPILCMDQQHNCATLACGKSEAFQDLCWQSDVQHRGALLGLERWCHISGMDSPADCGSRGLFPSELIDHNLWWEGLYWLKLPSSHWPDQSQILESSIPEEEKEFSFVTVAQPRTLSFHLINSPTSLTGDSGTVGAHGSGIRGLDLWPFLRSWISFARCCP